jgi:hypothetical protein
MKILNQLCNETCHSNCTVLFYFFLVHYSFTGIAGSFRFTRNVACEHLTARVNSNQADRLTVNSLGLVFSFMRNIVCFYRQLLHQKILVVLRFQYKILYMTSLICVVLFEIIT